MTRQENASQPMLSGQREVWTAQQLSPGSSDFNCSGYLDIRGELDIGRFKDAYARVVTETAHLWCTVQEGHAGPSLHPSAAPVLTVRDLVDLSDGEQVAVAEMHTQLTTFADATRATPALMSLYRLAKDRHFFHTQYHHVLFDGYAQVLFWRRLSELYRNPAISDPGYASHAELIAEEALLAPKFEANADTLAEQLTGQTWSVALPPGHSAGGVTQRVESMLPVDPSAVFARTFNTRWSTVITALVASYLRRISDANQIVLGFPTRGRHTPAQRATPTMLSNELPLFLDIDPSDTLAEVILQVDDQVAALLKHSEVRGAEVLRRARRKDPGVHRPNVVLNVMSFSGSIEFGEATGHIEQISTGPARELSLDIYRLDNNMRVSLATDGDTAGRSDIARHLARLTRLFAGADKLQMTTTVAELDILPASERAELRSFNATARAMPPVQDITRVIDDIAAQHGDTLALSGEGGVFDYHELAATMHGVASRLRAAGLQPGDVVGVNLARSTKQVCAALGVLHAGGAYLPLDPTGPGARRDYILEDSSPAFLISDEPIQFELPDGCTALVVDDLLTSQPTRPDKPFNPEKPFDPELPAYLIYTSGSTGRPKGVLVSHTALWNRLQWMKDDYNLTASDVYLQKTNPTFDVAMWELLLPLMTGARLHSLRSGHERDPRVLAEVMHTQQVTVAHFVPTMLDAFLREVDSANSSLRRLFASGEALRSATVAAFLERLPECELHNLYGPTEAAIDVTAWACSLDDVEHGMIPIGRPVANTQISVVDPELKEVPIGVTGELCIHGVQLAIGYLNQPDLSRDRFIEAAGLPSRAYRTGDIVRWSEDGVLEYLGRSDDQIKIHGYRVELGEIESQVQKAADADEVAVVPGADGDQLSAFLVGARNAPESFREALARELPHYMIPTRWLHLDQVPRLPNGKRDMRALRDLAANGLTPLTTQTHPAQQVDAMPPAPAEIADVRPVIDHTQALCDSFARVLEVDDIDVDADFFAYGGDSMRAIRLRSLVEETIGRTFAIESLYADATPRALVQHLQNLVPKTHVEPFALISNSDRELLPPKIEDAYPLTSMQQGILYQYAHDHESTVYRVVTSVTVGQHLDQARLVEACATVFARHPQLRTTVDMISFSQPLQLVHEEMPIRLAREPDLDGLDEAERDAAISRYLDTCRSSQFDLDGGPLVHFGVHHLSAESFQLTAIEHHVALDGWSDVLLFEEIVTAYTGRMLSPVPASTYADHVAFELAGIGADESLEFWRGQLQGAQLPEIFGRRAIDHATVLSQIDRFEIPISASTAAALTELAQQTGVSLKTVLTAAHVLAISTASGRVDIVTGVIANARPEMADAEKMIGVFLNTLPLRTTLAGSVRDLLLELHRWEQAGTAHRFLPFGLMEREIRDDVRLSDLQTYINFMDFRRGSYQATGAIQLTGIHALADTNYPAAVDFMLSDEVDGITGWIDGNLGVFTAAELQRLASLHEEALKALIHTDLDAAVRTIELLGADQITAALGPQVVVADNLTVLTAIRKHARNRPNAPALSYRDETWTYAELLVWVDRYSRELHERGVGPGDTVAIHLARSNHPVAAILGIHQLNAHYVPLDPTFPVSRLSDIVEDAAPSLVISDAVRAPAFLEDREMLRPSDLTEQSAVAPTREPRGNDLAYVIYTSGSTGKPKGVPITNRNLTNFMQAMDLAVGCEHDDVMLAATSLSFDISVLELLWPLWAGAHVVVADSLIAQHITPRHPSQEHQRPALKPSLFFFAAAAANTDESAGGYQLLLDAAKFADANGFAAIWTPERHFHPFGGLYPNPALTSAALATVTSQVQLRSGSVVAPLHDPLRLAEEWAVVDQLSGGRVGLAFASGWNSNDFALAPDSYADRKAALGNRIEEFIDLWEGRTISRVGGSGEQVELRTYPSPVQKRPPMWLTSVGTPQTFIDAGQRGFNVLTHLFGQDLATLGERIQAYRQARADAGYTTPGTVSLMLHTFLHADDSQARAIAREPFKAYLGRATELWRTMFATTGQEFPEENAEEYLDAVLDVAVDRYFETAGLFGSPESRSDLLDRIRGAGVDEVAALIDFGVPSEKVMAGLDQLAELFARHQHEIGSTGHSLTEQFDRYGVTMFQATPSVMATIARDEGGMESLKQLRALLVGGEQFPLGLATELVDRLPQTRVFNMYGPTETTIWSTVEEVRRVADRSALSVGRPIANTTVTVLDPLQRHVPTGVAGELWIAGACVSPGYLKRPELTADRFREIDGMIYYGTGDLARFTPEGKVHIIGRVDRQVKVHGQRVELDEIEGVLSRQSHVAEAAVKLNGSELVAYLLPAENVITQSDAVETWATLWNDAYDGEQENPYAGWTSSYTDRPIDPVEMEEWTQATMERVLELPHKRVLEIGMGTGLIRAGLGDEPDFYLGIDPAEKAVARGLRDGRFDVMTEFRCGDYSALSDYTGEPFDLVILNSVAQYFPSIDYLSDTLVRAVELLNNAGSVFVGDIRSYQDLRLFYLDIETTRGNKLESISDLVGRVDQRANRESELCVSPSFFVDWARHNGLTASVWAKRTDTHNEMSSFRYDIVLTKEPQPAQASTQVVEWSSLASVQELLEDGNDALQVLGVPNHKLRRPYETAQCLESLATSETVWELERATWPQLRDPAPTIEQLESMARTHKRLIEISPSQDSLVTLDVRFSAQRGG